MKRETFSSARARILAELFELGWEISSNTMKVPYARSPQGNVALFFRPQAVYFAPLGAKQSAASAAKESRSTWVDIRGASVEFLLSRVGDLT